MVKLIFFALIYILTLLNYKTLSKNLISISEESEIATITKDDESALREAVNKLNKNGGTIYINTPFINIKTKDKIQLTGSNPGWLVGIKQSNGEYPRIDFKQSRDAGATVRAIQITGSNQYVKNLILENSGGNAIYIKGSKNTIDHIIARYNANSGIQLSDGADSNTINYCYSYRNCDVKTYGANADGFAPKLGATNTVFNYCFAWDNSDDGWDSFDKEGDNSAVVTYLHSACWNNGNPDVFTGKYDYDNGKSLDKNMWTVQQLMSSDSNFESNYNNKKFSIDNGKINGVSANEWISKAIGEMNGNGFKFGSSITAKDPSVKRKAEWSVAFDHKSKGFDNNNSQKCTGYFTNCVSFNNKINYQLPYTFAKWENMWSWGATSKEQNSMSQTLKTPKNINSAQKSFYSIRDQIIKAVMGNTFPDNINFDSAIKSLQE